MVVLDSPRRPHRWLQTSKAPYASSMTPKTSSKPRSLVGAHHHSARPGAQRPACCQSMYRSTSARIRVTLVGLGMSLRRSHADLIVVSSLIVGGVRVISEK